MKRKKIGSLRKWIIKKLGGIPFEMEIPTPIIKACNHNVVTIEKSFTYEEALSKYILPAAIDNEIISQMKPEILKYVKVCKHINLETNMITYRARLIVGNEVEE